MGEYGALTLADARRKAQHWLELIRQGRDPRDEEERQRLSEQRKRANSFAAVAEDFIAEKLPGERRGKEVEQNLRREFIPVWVGDRLRRLRRTTCALSSGSTKDRGARYQAHNPLSLSAGCFVGHRPASVRPGNITMRSAQADVAHREEKCPNAHSQ